MSCDDKGDLNADDILSEPLDCNNAGQDTPVPCTKETIVVKTTCGHSYPTVGCCAPVTATPQPYYVKTAECVQSHEPACIVNGNVDLVINNAFNLPACGGSALLSVPDITGLMVGGYIWNPQYGYLRVINFDQVGRQITVQNDCQAGNAAPGTSVPAYTRFIMTPAQSASSGAGGTPTGPYLAVDFTAPPVGECINISVTTAAGLTVGKSTAIAGGTYRVAAVINASTITICNDGSGVTPNTQVLARNASGVLQYPLITLDDNPCSHTAIFSGKLLVCHDGIQAPLVGLLDDQIPVFSTGDGEVKFKSLGIPVVDCTALTAGLTLDPLNAPGTIYLVIVEDTTKFSVSDFVVIGNTYFTVTSIEDDTHMHIQPTIDPVDIVTYFPGSPLCGASCCDRLSLLENTIYINQNANGHKTRESTAVSATAADVTSGTLTTGQNAGATEGNISVVNATDLPMDVRVHYKGDVQYIVNGSATQYIQVNHALFISQGVAPGAIVQVLGQPTTSIIPAGQTSALYSSQIIHEEVFTIPAQETWIFKFNSNVQNASGNATNITIVHHTARAVITGTTQL